MRTDGSSTTTIAAGRLPRSWNATTAGSGSRRVPAPTLHPTRNGLPISGTPSGSRAGERSTSAAVPVAFTQVSRRLGEFETIVMFGNNFGLFGHPRRARWLLRRLRNLTSPTARVLAESRDPYVGAGAEYRRYHAFNRRRGRLPGQLRIRVRCGGARTPWFEYLLVSPREMRALVVGTGWRVKRLFRSGGPLYVAVL